MGSRRRRRTALAAVLLTSTVGAALGCGDPAEAGVAARARAGHVTSSATWSAVSSLTTSSPGAGSATVTGGLTVTSQYVWVVNNGTAPLTAAGYSGRYRLNASGLQVGRIDLRGCIGATASWNETTNVCTNGTVVLLTSTDAGLPTQADPALPVAPGGSIRLRVSFVGVTVLTAAQVLVDVTRRTGVGVGTTTSS